MTNAAQRVEVPARDRSAFKSGELSVIALGDFFSVGDLLIFGKGFRGKRNLDSLIVLEIPKDNEHKSSFLKKRDHMGT